jgi:hypothetical protein
MRGRTYSADCTSQNTSAEEDIESPLQLMALIVHSNQIDTACIVTLAPVHQGTKGYPTWH